jgi:multidrug efflux system membrane fusion protein
MNRRWLMVASVLFGAGMAVPGCQQAQSGGFKLPDPIVVYDVPITRTVTDYEEFPGYTDSPRSVNIRARVSGYLTNFYFTDGEMVQEGDKLFEIDPRPYKADRDRAKGTVEQLEAHKRRVEKAYNRAKNLLATRSVSPEEYDMYEADYRETLANIEVAKANLDLAELNVSWTEIRAPTSGLISRRMVDPGNLVKNDDTILTSIVRLDPLYVYFDVDEQAMLRLKRLMQEGKIKVKAQGKKEVPVQIGLSDEKDFPHEGIGDFMDNRVDANTGTLHFRATISNPEDAYGNRFIIPGLFVRVRLQIGDPHRALLIREQALVTDQGNKKVWVVHPKTNSEGQPETDERGQPKYVAQMRAVTLGVLRDGFREIQDGIAPDEKVVVMGMQRLRAGITVKLEKYDERSTAEAGTGQEPANPSVKDPVGAAAKERPSSAASPDRAAGASSSQHLPARAGVTSNESPQPAGAAALPTLSPARAEKRGPRTGGPDRGRERSRAAS